MENAGKARSALFDNSRRTKTMSEIGIEEIFTSPTPAFPVWNGIDNETCMITARLTDQLGMTESSSFRRLVPTVMFRLAPSLEPMSGCKIRVVGDEPADWQMNLRDIAAFYLDSSRLGGLESELRRDTERAMYTLMHSAQLCIGKN